jgi:hypothetical protein
MTVRLARSALLLAVLILMPVAVTGCVRGAAPTPASTSSSPSSPAVGGYLSQTDPAAWAGVQFQLAHCRWDWRQPLAVYVGAQRAFATPAYGVQLASLADPVSWQVEVVAEQQLVTCTVRDPRRVPNAPSTSTSVYVRMTVASHVVSTRGSFDTGTTTASWRVDLVAGKWLVAGPFTGG